MLILLTNKYRRQEPMKKRQHLDIGMFTVSLGWLKLFFGRVNKVSLEF